MDNSDKRFERPSFEEMKAFISQHNIAITDPWELYKAFMDRDWIDDNGNCLDWRAFLLNADGWSTYTKLGEQLSHLINNVRVPMVDRTYMKEDGILYCSVCHKPVQIRVNLKINNEEKIVGCICDCVKKRDYQIAKARKRAEIDRAREICFSTSKKLRKWTFETENRENPGLTRLARQYVEKFDELKTRGEGLLLYGSVGTGKTVITACIANALIDKGYKVLLRNISDLVIEIEKTEFGGKGEYLKRLNHFSLLILDDLGEERQTSYIKELVYLIINSRLIAGLPIIVTSNVERTVLFSSGKLPVEDERIYDRLLEHCYPKEVTGESKRKKKLLERLQTSKNNNGDKRDF